MPENKFVRDMSLPEDYISLQSSTTESTTVSDASCLDDKSITIEVEAEKYGTSKPKRIVLRGKIIK